MPSLQRKYQDFLIQSLHIYLTFATMMYNHLLINHLPIFATLFGIILVVVSLVIKNSVLRITALSMLAVGGLSFYPAFETGEGAHHEIEKRADFDKPAHHAMHEHEETAEFAMPFVLGMGLLAIAGIVLEARKSKYSQILAGVIGALGIAVVFMLAQVNNTGGQIRHPEIRKATTETPKSTKDDD
ncbi:MAG: hypothetical protein EAZ95_03370 [Bacteroidetes bacterium]|nr:MAG: hypothetical protein EAZ95_03370 [Bacteroidota bacterium]